MLERAGENTAIPIRDCLYPKCEECDDYHGRYCTVPIVITKQKYRLTEDLIADLSNRLTELENLVTDEILGAERPTREVPCGDLNLTWDEYLKMP